MSYTKANLRIAIQQMIDDPNAARWTAPNLDALTERTHDELWAELHEIQPWLTSQLDTFTAAQLLAPGKIDIRVTGDGAGQLSKRFFRVQRLIRDRREYDEFHELSQKARIVVAAGLEISAPQFTYFVQGTEIWIHPLTVTSDVELRYAYLPTAYQTLAEGATVEWPSGYEAALINEVAARALVKGDAEDMRQMKVLANEAFDRCKNALSRRMIHAQRMQAPDDAIHWGA